MKKSITTGKSFSFLRYRNEAGRPPLSRLPAFTLAETITVLVISSLLVAIAYAALKAVEHRYYLFRTDSEKLSCIVHLQQALDGDFRKSRSLRHEGGFIYAAHDSAVVVYQLLDSLIVRSHRPVPPVFISQEKGQDTFRLHSDAAVFKWRGSPVEGRAGLLDEVVLHIIYREEKYPLHFHKAYDSRTLWETDTYPH